MQPHGRCGFDSDPPDSIAPARPAQVGCSAREIRVKLSVPPYWREVLNRNPVSMLALQQRGIAGKGPRNIGRSTLATVQGWRFTQNAIDPLTLAGPLLVRRLLDVLEDETVLDDAPPAREAPKAIRPPTTWDTARFVAAQAVRAALLAASRPAGAITRGLSPSVPITADFVPITTALSRTVFRMCLNRKVLPTPIPLSLTGKGETGSCGAAGGGDNWTAAWTSGMRGTSARRRIREPRVVLERRYHLSYPFLIQKGSDIFLLPESASNHTIELYRASRFPDMWELEKELCSNISAVDTSAVFLDGIWYFFTTSLSGGNETFLFWSEKLDGDWHYHPRNPICTDIRRSRGAGALFRQGGNLMRPVQDCSGCYGYAITLNRVTRLSVTDYSEEPVETILPNWRKGLLATHTLNSSDAYEVIDATRYAP